MIVSYTINRDEALLLAAGELRCPLVMPNRILIHHILFTLRPVLYALYNLYVDTESLMPWMCVSTLSRLLLETNHPTYHLLGGNCSV